jgi:hypothetical protein
MLRFAHTSTSRLLGPSERLQRKEDTRLSLPECWEELKGLVASPRWAAAWPALWRLGAPSLKKLNSLWRRIT